MLFEARLTIWAFMAEIAGLALALAFSASSLVSLATFNMD